MASATTARTPTLELIGTTNVVQGQQLNQQSGADKGPKSAARGHIVAGKGLNGNFVIFKISHLAPYSTLRAVRVSLLAVKSDGTVIFISSADVPPDVLSEQPNGALVHCPSTAAIRKRTHVQVNWISYLRQNDGSTVFIVHEGSVTKKNKKKDNGETGTSIRVRLEVMCHGAEQPLQKDVDIKWQSNLGNGRKEACREELALFRVAYNFHAARTIRHVLECGKMDPSSPSDKMGNLDYLLEHTPDAIDYVSQLQRQTNLNGDFFLRDTVRSFLPSRVPKVAGSLKFSTTQGACFLKEDTASYSATPGGIKDVNEAYRGPAARGHISAIDTNAPLAEQSSALRASHARAGPEGACLESIRAEGEGASAMSISSASMNKCFTLLDGTCTSEGQVCNSGIALTDDDLQILKNV
ncbi:Hypothetical Protein FCC1311_029002 [Hondaea fermentalgiana]|uniref:Uncharacterized protein n=1 Tax=Hondaea fermentalgiana TaxID=2315210 RepID=A0A2R5G8M0_9STRA|nr:Hypothetical Protein FCC1311_029002 [Hondaea fermentalgiana]|eukprot:GBG26679.1 Hypothetical Protein FCC1311_029002 [Hondaea fermentalgiana]